MRAGWIFAMLAGVTWGQTAPDAAVIGSVRQNIRAYLDQLPRITCTENTRQTIHMAGAESTETREDSCDTHRYKLYSVQTLSVLGGKYFEPNQARSAPEWREQLKDASLDANTGFLESAYVAAEVMVEFAAFDVEGRELNLPAHSRVRFRMNQGDTTNEAAYSAYRMAEFGADTQIRFAADSAPSGSGQW